MQHESYNDKEDECNILVTNVNLYKEKVVWILRLEDKRPTKLSIDELMYLLSLFNQAGIWLHD
ncbi:putative ribosomal RNA adenine methyltransferase KsgA/Erm [Helianthus anomalus]